LKEFELFDLDAQDNTVANQDSTDIKNKKHRRYIYNPVAAQREAEAKQMAVWKAYQEAIIKSGQLTSEITKGIQAGEKIEILFLKAIECISLMTDDKLFYELNKNNLKNVYGFPIENLEK
jgi:hypothetical protein